MLQTELDVAARPLGILTGGDDGQRQLVLQR